jgi:hypothetical protein
MDSSKKIGIMGICILIFIALVADLLSIIPLVGTIIGPLFWILVAVYLWVKGFGFLNLRRAAPMILSTAGELIPAIQALPTILAGTIALIFILKVQEKTGLSLTNPTKGTLRPTVSGGLNQNGVRMPTQNLETPSTNRNANTQPLVVDGIRAPQK